MNSTTSREDCGQLSVNPTVAFSTEDVAAKSGPEGPLMLHLRPRDFFLPYRLVPCLAHGRNPVNICCLNLAENRNGTFQCLENKVTVGCTYTCITCIQECCFEKKKKQG